MGLIDNSFLEKVINTETKEVKTPVDNAVVQAKNDFKYLCSNKNILCRDYNDFVAMEKTRDIGKAYVVRAELKDKEALVPQDKVDFNEATNYVAVIVYNEGKVTAVYMFTKDDFAKPMGLFSTIKKVKKTNQYSINISKPDKIVNNLFGVVMKAYI